MKLWITSLIYLTASYSFAQNTIVNHKYLASLKPDVLFFNENPNHYRLNIIDRIKYLNTYHNLISIEFKSYVSSKDEYFYLKNHPDISTFQKTHTLNHRGCNPNDPAYLTQYNMELMKFDEIWCLDTSGLSPVNDTLVVAVVENGFSYWLDDMLPNIYSNRLEIPDNGIDDDQNGYLDDYLGYNSKSANGGDDHQANRHGTEVISVIGAKGNNKSGLTGTNPNIKILLCSAEDSNELLECYYYFIKMKRDYLNSNGSKGAFIVSSNLSAGFDAFPEDYPFICEAYDSLGNVGVLNSVATINDNYDIDIVGDVPGLCPSPYLIVVTNTDRNDIKVEAGFSKINVDISAAGEDIPMLDESGMIREASGCSFSSPHVAGTISLLYQFCSKLTELNKKKPSQAVSILRQIILDCGDHLPTLENITVSENRLNAYKALVCLNRYCAGDTLHKEDIVIYNNFGNGPVKLKFSPSNFGIYDLFIYNNLGQYIDHKILHYDPGSNFIHEFEIDHWPSGVYHFYISGMQTNWSGRLIKI